jgi:hypothetical protein
VRRHLRWPLAGSLLCLVTVIFVVAIATDSGSTGPNATYQAAVASDTPVPEYRFDEVSGTSTKGLA